MHTRCSHAIVSRWLPYSPHPTRAMAGSGHAGGPVPVLDGHGDPDSERLRIRTHRLQVVDLSPPVSADLVEAAVDKLAESGPVPLAEARYEEYLTAADQAGEDGKAR
ncbi:hypothetical protein [Streptomyces sp. GQFP]|uniref:hypothetical protein n=1 Tax=Streptomyces sp. GQFP TaxID=2907545 RepID=UPI001F415833|nr:hypothetical protein [Streptomyces sp. GQFP]UIX32170.1 hypothetical protein LUX31_20155 [Streptomyces sp. GQFP]